MNRAAPSSPLKSIIKTGLVYTLSACITILQFSSTAGASAIAQEAYTSRPDVLQLKAKNHKMEKTWAELRRAHFAFVAELLTLYPNEPIYFLARDSEYLYDTARLVTEGTPDAERIHLLNVSRGNMNDPNAKDYLAENGITAKLLKTSRIILVDTGFAGTIPENIAEKFAEDSRPNIKTHLIVSSSARHPSSRVFLLHLNPSINSLDPGEMHNTVVKYEHMPRYTDRSDQYKRQSGHWEALSPITAGGADGQVSKEKATHYMESLIAAWEDEKFRAEYAQRLQLFQNIFELFEQAKKNKNTVNELKKLLADSPDKVLVEAMIRDLIESASNRETQVKINLKALDLKAVEKSAEVVDKMDLIALYPQWTHIFKNPDKEIPLLFKNQDYQTIGALLDIKLDMDMNSRLTAKLFANSASGVLKTLQVRYIEKSSMSALMILIEDVLNRKSVIEMQDLLKLIIDKGSHEVREILIARVLTNTFAVEMRETVAHLVEKGSQNDMKVLLEEFFRQPHSAKMPDLLEKVIAKAKLHDLGLNFSYIFNKPNGADHAKAAELAASRLRLIHLKYILSTHEIDFKYEPVIMFWSLALKKLGKAEASDLLYKISWSRFDRFPTGLKDLLDKTLDYFTDKEVAQFLRTFRKNFDSNIEVNEYIEQSLAKHTLVTDSNGKTSAKFSSISKNLKADNKIQINGNLFTVIKTVASGKRGLVFQLKDSKGILYALKVAIDNQPETLNSLAKESEKMAVLAELDIDHAEVLVQGKNYVLKPWVAGITGEQWLEKYEQNPDKEDKALKALYKTVTEIILSGAYVGDFRPPNVIWTGKSWVVVDAGSTQTGLTAAQALAKVKQKFPRRWELSLAPIEKEIKAKTSKLQCKKLLKN